MTMGDPDSVVRISRRQVLRVFPKTGAALVLGLCFERCGIESETDAWLKIDAAGNIDIVVARSEMGQGVRTALPMIVAEELEADWSKIRVLPALADRGRYGDQTTGGSLSIRTSWKRLRRVGATARTMLVSAAAGEWSVPEKECRAEVGYVIHAASGRRLGYGELAKAAARQGVPQRVRLKEASEFRLVGQPIKRLDTPAKVRGRAKFGIDVRIPNMVFAALARPPPVWRPSRWL
ncbi:MAG: molybdopterin-dependent oxidoreductase [Acidobacteria bacterium]|nr:molybdopterin-dependent oxidoreductase [Acidobacteriota bacterium]